MSRLDIRMSRLDKRMSRLDIRMSVPTMLVLMMSRTILFNLKEKRDHTNPSEILIAKVAINFIRWLLLAFIIIKLDDRVWLQVMLCMYLNQAYTMFIMYNTLYEDK